MNGDHTSNESKAKSGQAWKEPGVVEQGRDPLHIAAFCNWANKNLLPGLERIGAHFVEELATFDKTSAKGKDENNEETIPRAGLKADLSRLVAIAQGHVMEGVGAVDGSSNKVLQNSEGLIGCERTTEVIAKSIVGCMANLELVHQGGASTQRATASKESACSSHTDGSWIKVEKK